jgi:WD40 repeat protein
MGSEGLQLSLVTQLQDTHSSVTTLAFCSEDNSLAVGTTEGLITIHNNLLSDSPSFKNFVGHTDTINDLVFSPDGHYLFSGAGKAESFVQDNRLLVWGLQRDEGVSRILSRPQSGITKISFSPDNKWMLSGDQDGSVLLFNAETGKFVETLDALKGYSWGFAFSPDGKLLAAANRSGKILLWDFDNQNILDTSFGDLNGDTTSSGFSGIFVNELLFSPDGRKLFSAKVGLNDQNEIHVWDTLNQESAGKTIIAPIDILSGIAISPDGRKFLIAGSNEAVIWNLDSMTLDYKLDDLGVFSGGKTWTAISSDFSKIAAAGSFDRKVPITSIDFSDPGESSSIAAGQLISRVEFSPDMKLLATGGMANGDEPIDFTFWDLSNGATLGRPLSGFSRIITTIAFRPDGEVLAAGDSEGTLLFLELNPQSWINYACKIIGRNLTIVEWEQYMSDREYRATCPQWPLELEPTLTP